MAHTVDGYEALQCNVRKSLHYARRELQFTQTKVQKIIHCNLKFYAYIIQVVQAVDLDGQPHWKEFSVGMPRWTSNDSRK